MPPGRRLSAEEQALWARVTATVRPLLAGNALEGLPPRVATTLRRESQKQILHAGPDPGFRLATASKASPPASDTLDGGWDRRLRKGAIQPDRTIDLHGHTLATAHGALEHALARAVADDVRVLLVVTGKPPKPDIKGRGLIRANIGNWLAGSGYRDRIAAVRNAHPRHGGTGALYLIFRRKRGG